MGSEEFSEILDTDHIDDRFDVDQEKSSLNGSSFFTHKKHELEKISPQKDEELKEDDKSSGNGISQFLELRQSSAVKIGLNES